MSGAVPVSNGPTVTDSALELDPHAKLDLAAGVRRADYSEGRTLEEAGSAQDRSVGYVDELRHGFQVRSFTQREALGKIHVGGRQPRAAERANSASSKMSSLSGYGSVGIPELEAGLSATQ